MLILEKCSSQGQTEQAISSARSMEIYVTVSGSPEKTLPTGTFPKYGVSRKYGKVSITNNLSISNKPKSGDRHGSVGHLLRTLV